METNFWTYLAVLKRRFWVILLLLAATMAVILGRAWTTPPAYRSSSTLQALPLEPEEVTLYTRLNTVSPSDSIDLIIFQFTNLVRSSRIAQQTLSEFNTGVTASEFLAGVSVERDPSGDVVIVSATAGNPDDAERLLQRHVDLALEDLRESRARPSNASGRFLETELAQVESDLKAARAAVLQFKLDNRIESLDRESAAQQQGVRDLAAAQQTAMLEVKRLAAVSGVLERQLSTAVAALAAAAPDSADAGSLKQRIQDLQTQIDDAAVRSAGQQAQADGISALLADRQTNLAALITLAGQYQTLLDAEQERLDNRDFLAAKVREAQLKESQSRTIGYLQVVTPPSTPRNRVPTRTVQTALLGAVLSIVAGVVLVFVLEFLERTLRHSPRPGPRPRREQAQNTGSEL